MAQNRLYDRAVLESRPATGLAELILDEQHG